MSKTPKHASQTNGHGGGERLADDLLRGAQAIADELGESLRRAHYMLEQRLIPAKKVGHYWYASRSQLREHFTAEPTNDEKAAP